MESLPKPPFRVSIDRGGTFTDLHWSSADGRGGVLKLLSEDDSYENAPAEGIRRALEKLTGEKIEYPLPTEHLCEIRMGTTVATNALLERKGEPLVLVVTKGFKDLLVINNQAREDIFDLSVSCRAPLDVEVVEIDERVVLEGGANNDGTSRYESERGVVIEKSVDEAAVEAALGRVRRRRPSLRGVAVALMHSAVFPGHELAVERIASRAGFSQISLSHRVSAKVKIIPRGFTAEADAYLTPKIREYIDTFLKQFRNGQAVLPKIKFMQSDGGLTSAETFSGHKAVLSGPAGGCVGYASVGGRRSGTTAAKRARSAPQIGFDMGGTSTDVSRFHERFEHVSESTTAGVVIGAPQLDVRTVAAGGGSRLFFENGLLRVGPESAGSRPGPLCYGRSGGMLAVTDANVVTGRISIESFPKCFGDDDDAPIDAAKSLNGFERMMLSSSSSSVGVRESSPENLALGFLEVAIEAMCRPIREITTMKGYNAGDHSLVCFGAAAGQHACGVAQSLGIRYAFLHRYAGVLSAYGISLADVVSDESRVLQAEYSEGVGDKMFEELETMIAAELGKKGGGGGVQLTRFLNLRFDGADSPRMVEGPKFDENLRAAHSKEFGFVPENRKILVEDCRVRGVLKSSRGEAEPTSDWRFAHGWPGNSVVESRPVDPSHKMFVRSGGWVEAPVFSLKTLARESHRLLERKRALEIEGPCLLVDEISTICVEPWCVARISPKGDVEICVPKSSSSGGVSADARCDPVKLSIFGHRFMGIAEQMGRTLQRTAVSVNVKERLDFSCALFDANGDLVSNAPHIPVHLGAMSFAVKKQIELRGGGDVLQGDVYLSNHPMLAGGSHLPDITVITPVFFDSSVAFWLASRGHHSDIGGIRPGSMPPDSTKLSDEGATFVTFLLVRNGKFFEREFVDRLKGAGARKIVDNISDVRAQIAANKKGLDLLRELVDEHSLLTVSSYMNFINENAESTVRSMLKNFARTHSTKAKFTDFLDDGTKIQLSMAVDSTSGDAVLDFSGTGKQVVGNLNAPLAVVYSAVVYALRSLVASEMPLNEGCLSPIKLIIPDNSVLSPSDQAAVVGGNVCTSQRVVDVVLGAFKACAASQGCMNNLSFGDSSFGFYETIAGGCGAGPTWVGASGKQSHMTNTRCADPEIFELTYPVVLREFKLRTDSGGLGKFKGGEGVSKKIEFLRKLGVSLLTERRTRKPYGMEGGLPGAFGINSLKRRNESNFSDVGGKAFFDVDRGDVLWIQTPGGGGYGNQS